MVPQAHLHVCRSDLQQHVLPSYNPNVGYQYTADDFDDYNTRFQQPTYTMANNYGPQYQQPENRQDNCPIQGYL